MEAAAFKLRKHVGDHCCKEIVDGYLHNIMVIRQANLLIDKPMFILNTYIFPILMASFRLFNAYVTKKTLTNVLNSLMICVILFERVICIQHDLFVR